MPATLLIALGAFFPALTDSLNRAGSTDLYQLGKFLGVLFLFAGFLVSVEVFREVRIPFTSIRLGTASRERARRRDAAIREGETAIVRAAHAPSGEAASAAPARPLDPAPATPARLCSRRWTRPTDDAPVEAPARIRVLLVDDHAVVRRGLHGFFELLTTSRSSARPRTGGAPSSWSGSSRPTSC